MDQTSTRFRTESQCVTVNKPEIIQQMIDLKVDFITTDEPLLVREMIQKTSIP